MHYNTITTVSKPTQSIGHGHGAKGDANSDSDSNLPPNKSQEAYGKDFDKQAITH